MSADTAGNTTTYVNVPLRNATDGYDQVTIIAETTETPGLVITPAIHKHGFAGGFCLTHTASGLVIPIDTYGADVEAARRIAAELGKLDVDWTLPMEQLTAIVGERKTEIRKAISAGRWTYDDSGDDEPSEAHEAGAYPKNIADATAENTIAALIRDGLQRQTDMWDLIRYDRENTAARDRYLDNVQALLADYGMVAVLRVLTQLDPAAADGIARGIWTAYDAGDSIGEELASWGEKYGIPVPQKISDRAQRTIADTRPAASTEPAEATPAG